MYNKAVYTCWGPHQRMTHPDPALLELRDVPDAEWKLDRICGGVWTIFPHISIAGGNGGGQVAQLFPGTTPGSARTILNYYIAAEPTEEQRAAAQEHAAFLEHVVRDEDYATGFGIQRALSTGARPSVMFGRNEGGGQRFHRSLDRYLAGEVAGVSVSG